jgi:hypothetical protein
MRRLVLLAILIMLTGCGGGGNTRPDWSVPLPKHTGVDPYFGDYDFVMDVVIESSITVDFSVEEQDGKKFVRLYHSKVIDGHRYGSGFLIPIEDGAATFHFGDIAPGEGSYPAEGFAISISFDSPTEAKGVIEFATYGNIIGKTNFVATFVEGVPIIYPSG